MAIIEREAVRLRFFTVAASSFANLRPRPRYRYFLAAQAFTFEEDYLCTQLLGIDLRAVKYLERQGYSICLVFLKLFERIYAPLTAGLLKPVTSDSHLQQSKRTQLDRLYQRIVDDLDQLLIALGLKLAA